MNSSTPRSGNNHPKGGNNKNVIPFRQPKKPEESKERTVTRTQFMYDIAARMERMAAELMSPKPNIGRICSDLAVIADYTRRAAP